MSDGQAKDIITAAAQHVRDVGTEQAEAWAKIVLVSSSDHDQQTALLKELVAVLKPKRQRLDKVKSHGPWAAVGAVIGGFVSQGINLFRGG